jgi:hypothetical protein
LYTGLLKPVQSQFQTSAKPVYNALVSQWFDSGFAMVSHWFYNGLTVVSQWFAAIQIVRAQILKAFNLE